MHNYTTDEVKISNLLEINFHCIQEKSTVGRRAIDVLDFLAIFL